MNEVERRHRRRVGGAVGIRLRTPARRKIRSAAAPGESWRGAASTRCRSGRLRPRSGSGWLGLARPWLEHRLAVEVHVREPGQTGDLSKGDAPLLVVPVSQCRKLQGTLGVLDFDRVAARAGPGHCQINQLPGVRATSFCNREQNCSLCEVEGWAPVTAWSRPISRFDPMEPCLTSAMCGKWPTAKRFNSVPPKRATWVLPFTTERGINGTVDRVVVY